MLKAKRALVFDDPVEPLASPRPTSKTPCHRRAAGSLLIFAAFWIVALLAPAAPSWAQTGAPVAAPPRAENPAASLDPDLLLNNGAVVLVYHRFGEGDLPSTNTTLEQFEAQIAELTSGPYNVLPLPDILAAFKSGKKLPDRTVAITIDDAYLSVFTEAWPRLRRAGLPFTVFIASDPVDREGARYMTWAHLKELAASELVTIGAHSASHPHMPNMNAEEVRLELQRSNARLERELGKLPEIFSYPFGEFSLRTRALVIEAGYQAAFAQNSGVLARNMDPFNLPRFALNEQYGTLERFRLIVNALPLPLSQITPQDSTLTADSNPPIYGFTLATGLQPLERLNCFLSGDVGMTMERLEQRVELRMAGPLPPGRSRVNCTLPGPDGRWRWNGRQFYLPPVE